MFKYLLDYGFDPKRRNKNRQTVKDVCKDQPELLDLLKDKFFSAEVQDLNVIILLTVSGWNI